MRPGEGAERTLDFLTAAFETANALVIVLDRELRIVLFNPACERTSGYRAAEVEGRPVSGLLAADEVELVERRLAAVRAGEFPNEGESHWVTRSGARRLIAWAETAVLGEDGTVEFLVGTGIDVTDRERAVEALLESEERFRLGFDRAPIGMALTRTDGRWLKVNRALCGMLGYTEDEMLATTFQAMTHPDDLEQSMTYLRRALAGELVSYQMETRFLHRDGHVAWALLAASLIRNPAGDPVYLISQIQDITDRRRAEEALRETNDTLRALVDASPAAIMSFDRHARVQMWNPAAERIFGWSKEEVTGRFNPIVDEEQHGEFLQYLERILGGESWSNEQIRRRRKDGSPIDASASSAPLRNADGEIVGMISVITDVTESKHLEEQLLQAQRLESVGRLAGGVAHDFNNLLTAISGYAEFLLAELDGTDRRRRDAEEIARAAERAAALVRQLLAFSRRQILEPRTIDLRAIVHELETMLRRLIGEDVELVVALDPSLGSVNADPAQIEQMIVNLAVNARDAMPEGGMLTIEGTNIDLDVWAATRLSVAPGRYVMLRVGDTGIGMDEETRSRVFEPFFTTKEQGKGTGLGLASVYGTVTQSGGAVDVDSEPHLGTTFRVYLPRVEPADGLGGAVSLQAAPSTGSETVLLVEDEGAVRELARRVLVEAGYHVLAAAGGWEAVDLSGQHPGPIHLLLTDIVMPGMSGPELAERIRATRPSIPILFMSGYTEDAVVQRGLSGNGTSFVAKPFTPSLLRRRVREILDRRPRLDEPDPGPLV